MLDLNVFQSTRSQTRCHANARRCVLLQTSSHGASIPALASQARVHTHTQLLSKTHFHHCSTLLVSAFKTNQPRTLLQPSTNHPQSTSVFRRGLPMIHHTSQPFPSIALGGEPIPDACLAFLECGATLVSDVSCDPRSARTRHCQRLCRVMQVESVSVEVHQDRYVSASEPSSISWSSFAADSVRTIDVLVFLQLSMPSIARMLSTRILALESVTELCDALTQEQNIDLPFSICTFEFQRFLQLHKARSFRFPRDSHARPQ